MRLLLLRLPRCRLAGIRRVVCSGTGMAARGRITRRRWAESPPRPLSPTQPARARPHVRGCGGGRASRPARRGRWSGAPTTLGLGRSSGRSGPCWPPPNVPKPPQSVRTRGLWGSERGMRKHPSRHRVPRSGRRGSVRRLLGESRTETHRPRHRRGRFARADRGDLAGVYPPRVGGHEQAAHTERDGRDGQDECGHHVHVDHSPITSRLSCRSSAHTSASLAYSRLPLSSWPAGSMVPRLSHCRTVAALMTRP